MSLLCDVLSFIFLLIGSCFVLIGGVGLLRFPDFFARLHGGGITDTMGAGAILLGLVFQSVKVGLSGDLGNGPWLVAAKLIIILFFLLITSPTGCHALARAALSDGMEPLLKDEEGGSTP